MAYPPIGARILILEEVHIKHQHIGAEKLHHLVAQQCYWPNMMAECKNFVGTCFECQISGGHVHGNWMGKLLPLPPGPRHTW